MRKRVLLLCSRAPYPLVGGDKIRYHTIISILSERYDVDVVYLTDQKKIISPSPNERSKIGLYRAFYQSKLKSAGITFWNLLWNRLPLQVNYYKNSALQQWLDQNYSQYDILFAMHIRMAHYLVGYKKYKTIDYVDSLAMNYEKAIVSTRNLLWKYIYKIEQKRVRKYERYLLTHFDSKIIISEIDRNYILEDRTDEQIHIVQNYVGDIESSKATEKEYHIGFLGKMNYEPNVSAVRYFVTSVFPTLKQKFLSLQFTIIGAFPTPEILSYNKLEGITVTGYVEKIEDYISACSLMVAPMVSGAGIQNKILQVMKMGKCVVTTPIGAEGLPELKGNELIIVRDTSEMINAISELLANPSSRQKIEAKAPDYINSYFSFNAIAAQLDKVLNQ